MSVLGYGQEFYAVSDVQLKHTCNPCACWWLHVSSTKLPWGWIKVDNYAHYNNAHSHCPSIIPYECDATDDTKMNKSHLLIFSSSVPVNFDSVWTNPILVFCRFTSSAIHPAILKLGVQYAEGVICGSNARCVALLSALRQVHQLYTPVLTGLCNWFGFN